MTDVGQTALCNLAAAMRADGADAAAVLPVTLLCVSNTRHVCTTLVLCVHYLSCVSITRRHAHADERLLCNLAAAMRADGADAAAVRPVTLFLCVRIYIYMNIYIYRYICIYICIYTYAYIYISSYICIHINVYIYTFFILIYI